MAKNFVSHTNGTETIDGATGQNNRLERGASVVKNPIWKPGSGKRAAPGKTGRRESSSGRLRCLTTPNF